MQEVGTGIYLTMYSTIASTLACSFGFLVAVMLYVMQSINTHIDNCADTLVDTSPADRKRLRRLRSSQQWQEMIDCHKSASRERSAVPADTLAILDEQTNEMRRAVGQLAVIRRELNQSMYMTGIVIFASLVGMPLTVFFLNPRSASAVSMLTLTIVCTMFCLRGYFRLIQAALVT